MTDIPLAIDRDPSAHFKWIHPEEALKSFEMERILVSKDKVKGTRTEILSFPDLDGQPLHIPIVISTKVEDYSPFPELEIAKVKITSRELLDEEKKRFEYCHTTLRLPDVLSTYLTFEGKHINLNDFKIPDSATKTPFLLSILGRAGGGKTTLAEYLSFKQNLPTFSLDKFTAYDLNVYKVAAQEARLTDDSNANDMVEAIEKYRARNPNMKVEDKRAITMRQTLNEMLEVFKNRERPELILVDGVGDKDEGIISANIYHFVSMYSLSGILAIMAPQDEHRGIFRLRPGQNVFLEFTRDKDKKPIIPPIIGIYYYTNLGAENPWKMRPEVLEDTLTQFTKSIPQILG